MTLHRFRTLLAISAATVTVFVIGVPAHAQMTVFDPSNYSQNVLTAARALQQVNNQIQSLQNQATSLINEARNLASLPYSALEQLQQTIGQTQQLLTQAQRITAQVTEDVYDSPAGKFRLIPQGARLIGQYDAQIAFGQRQQVQPASQCPRGPLKGGRSIAGRRGSASPRRRWGPPDNLRSGGRARYAACACLERWLLIERRRSSSQQTPRCRLRTDMSARCLENEPARAQQGRWGHRAPG